MALIEMKTLCWTAQIEPLKSPKMNMGAGSG